MCFQGELRLCHREWTKNPAETTGMRYKNGNLMSRKQKRMGSVGCFGQKENIKRQSLTYFEHFMTDKCKPPKTDVYPVCYGVAPDTLYETLPA